LNEKKKLGIRNFLRQVVFCLKLVLRLFVIITFRIFVHSKQCLSPILAAAIMDLTWYYYQLLVVRLHIRLFHLPEFIDVYPLLSQIVHIELSEEFSFF